MDTREVRAAFLEEVKQAVCKDRTKSHGQPEDNFRNIAWLWTGWLRGRYHLDVDLDAIDVGYMSILLKVARAESNPMFRDHAVDTAGYAACIGGILASEAVPEQAEERPATIDSSDGPGGAVYVAYKAPDPEPGFVPTHYRNLDGTPVQVLSRGLTYVTYRTGWRTDHVLPSAFDRDFTPKEKWDKLGSSETAPAP